MKHFSIAILFLLPLLGAAQTKKDLPQLLKQGNLEVYHRRISEAPANEKPAVYLDGDEGEGIAWIKGQKFSEGTIEVDLKGKDVFQKSFLGIAFHGQNDSTYDAIYFRPFNFRTTDSVRRIHAVQYIAHPTYPWKKLRDEQNGKYEKAVEPAPDPNQWFHARILIEANNVSVYVNNKKEPVLSVQKLNNRSSGKIGLWVGDGADGSFANLIIKEKK
ncbi:family 16 glycoside hydrolase [Desertivirga arenae]|uniref:family 16 glycoside hydrolase n=1 Tax=Desertivirga arenae TaxID=2810309 RepID=UPI001A95FF0D|nr:family 16 glycoside hydrolase [Pedobacter sp. SYSU D00823]